MNGFHFTLTDEELINLKTIAEYNKRSASGQLRHMIGVEYDSMKRDLSD